MESVESIREQFKRFWCEVLKVESLPEGADFFALGGSSINAVQLAAVVQERLGVALDAIEVVKQPSFDELLGTVLERARRQP